MSSDLAKNYEPAEVEKSVYQTWLAEKAFAADPAAPGEPYCIVMPPPNVTGALHLGHAINDTLQDILIRTHRMRGFNVLWVPGIDHAGIATQAVVEKQLKEKENKTRHDVGREGLVERIWKWKQEFGDRILSQLARLGCSCDWGHTTFTLDPGPAAAVRETFFKLFKDGLIYRGKRLVNWDIHLQTSISDDEIYHETVKTSMWHIRYPIDGTDREMIVATTRPETMLGDTAVAVHSDDARWNWAIGKHVKLPLTDRLIPIIADNILVDPKFGTGVVKVTPAHDPNDYAVYQRHLGKPDEIGIINILNPDGTLNEAAGKYAGMKREAARKKVVEDLGGLLVKEEPYETQVGHSDRSKTPVEPYLSDQWFVKMAALAEPALQAVRDGVIKFFPERHAQQYLAWLGEKRDWPISRQLWWGHRIPVWTKHFDDIKEFWGAPGSQQDELNDWLGLLNAEESYDRKNHLSVKYVHDGDDTSTFRDRSPDTGGFLVLVTPNADVVPTLVDGKTVEVKKLLEASDFVQDPDVLDTWFSSALWPHSTLGWPKTDSADLAKWYPTNVLLTGRDIITLWVARMVMMGMYNMGEKAADAAPHTPSPLYSGERAGVRGSPLPAVSVARSAEGPSPQPSPPGTGERENMAHRLGVPFAHVVINPTILDGKGERMSKTKGNGVDPVDIIDGYGADAMRFTLTTMATETQDARLPVKKDAQGRNTSEKFDSGRNFCNKLWNAARFAISNVESIAPEAPVPANWSLVDRWIIARFSATVAEANTALEHYRFDQYARACYDFFWRDFCDWYVEASKPALKDPNRAGQTATILAAVLDGILRLMHPMIPFVTEKIFWRLNEVRPQRGLPDRLECPASPRLIRAAWPEAPIIADDASILFPRLQEMITAIRNARNQHKVDPRTPVGVAIAGDAATLTAIDENRATIELLASCNLLNAPPTGEALRVPAGGCELAIYGLADPNADAGANAKRCEELKKQVAAMKGRLESPGYLAKAPAHLVEQTRDQLAEAESELSRLQC